MSATFDLSGGEVVAARKEAIIIDPTGNEVESSRVHFHA
jgi:hypothetical protein